MSSQLPVNSSCVKEEATSLISFQMSLLHTPNTTSFWLLRMWIMIGSP